MVAFVFKDKLYLGKVGDIGDDGGFEEWPEIKDLLEEWKARMREMPPPPLPPPRVAPSPGPAPPTPPEIPPPSPAPPSPASSVSRSPRGNHTRHNNSAAGQTHLRTQHTAGHT